MPSCTLDEQPFRPAQCADLECVFVIGRFYRTMPGAMEFFQHLLRRRAAGIENAVQRIEMAGFVTAEMVDMAAPAQACMRQHQAFPCDLEQIAMADFGLEAEPPHVIAERLPLLRGPAVRDFPRPG